VRSNVVGDLTEVFADDLGTGGFGVGENLAEMLVAVSAVEHFVFLTVIGSGEETGEVTFTSGGGVFFTEREKFGVVFWVPGEGVDAVEAKNVIDAEQVKEVAEFSNAALPPAVVVLGNGVPVVEGNAPVLPPLDGEGVVLEEGFWGGAAKPVEVEPLGLKEDIGGVVGDANGDVTHELDAALVGMLAEVSPLTEGVVLNPSVVVEGLRGFLRGVVELFLEVITGFVWGVISLVPVRPDFGAVFNIL